MFSNDGVSAYLKMMEAQDKVKRKLSMLESPVMLAMKRSAMWQYENSSAARAIIKSSMPLGVNDVMNSINEKLSSLDSQVALSAKRSAMGQYENSSVARAIVKSSMALGVNDVKYGIKEKISPLESQVSLAIKLARSPQLSGAFEISKASRLLEPSQEWKRKMGAISHPLMGHSAAFKVFHEQSSKVAKLLNPSIANFIKRNVRTRYKDDYDVSVIEAAFLETFEGIKDDITNELQNEISDTIAANPAWKSTMLSIAVAVKNDQLENETSVLLGDLIIKKLKTKKPAVIRVFMMMIVLLISHVPTVVENYNSNQENLSNRRKNLSQDKKINKLETRSKKQNRIKKDKEKLHNHLNKSLPDYKEKLLLKFKEQTVDKYTLVASTFADYLYEHTEYTDITQVTKNDVENFIADVQFDVLKAFKTIEIRNRLGRFLVFMKTKKR